MRAMDMAMRLADELEKEEINIVSICSSLRGEESFLWYFSSSGT
jgi:hypothetical protein